MAKGSTARAFRLESWTLPSVFALSGAWLTWLAWSDLAPGDSGEIGSASFVLGVAHPTGFPLDLLLLRACAFLPLGPLALRQNVCVAWMSAAVVTAVAALAMELARRMRLGVVAGMFGGACAALGLLSFETFVGSAVGVEVYSTALGLVSCAALAVLRGGRATHLAWVLLGLSVGAHVTAGFLMAPVIGALLLARRPQSLRGLLPHAVMAFCAALLLAYLPLAALRDPPLNWGDPRTFGRVVEHLTAARIRASYAAEMFTAGPLPAASLVSQLAAEPVLLVAALLGVFVLLSRVRQVALVVGAVVAFDLAYAIWVNPMGIAQRQLGHATGAAMAVCAGVFVAELCEQASRAAYLRALVPLGVIALFGATWLRAPWPPRQEGYVLAERHGSGSPLVALPPRSIYLCSNDSSCSAALFAAHVERVRPDVTVAPAQHLWDRAVLWKLGPVLSAMHVSLPPDEPREPRMRAALAAHVLSSMVAKATVAPVFFEVDDPVAKAVPGSRVVPGSPAPLLRVALAPSEPGSAARAIAEVEREVRARFGAAGPRERLARDAWFDAYDTVGKAALLLGDTTHAILALRRAIALSPLRAVGHSNLGVALESTGDLAGAIAETRKAIELEPRRPAAWANLARLALRVGNPKLAHEVLQAAHELGIRDPRLGQVARQLAQGAPTRGPAAPPSANDGKTSN